MKSKRQLAGILGLSLLVSGCALLRSAPPPLDTYSLSAPTVTEGPRRPRIQILVAEPTALKALEGERIVIFPAPDSIEYLSGAQWADRLPRVIQLKLADAFQQSGRFGGVGKPGEGLAIDYQIITEVRRFGIEAFGASGAVVELNVRLLNDRTGVVRASQTFTARAPLGGGEGNAAYVNALDAAFSQVGADIIRWAASSI
ncbi:ABC-type transport auxiliary lipoprotein family protein [Tianweitania sediminis]|uniref:ABC-type transport auxiliary lipoprotein family protein n=1 Tax=Tianweitania sediminis TaxID=1502156 RepID=UPI0031596262|nr:ABC-type transport auxiliary lipoprotein family protein [Tianweitania sediminis]